MSKYRIKETGGKFYPQKKGWFFWHYFPNSLYTPPYDVDDDEEEIEWFPCLTDARMFLTQKEHEELAAKTKPKSKKTVHYHKFPWYKALD